jgi:hypothetical protein
MAADESKCSTAAFRVINPSFEFRVGQTIERLSSLTGTDILHAILAAGGVAMWDTLD